MKKLNRHLFLRPILKTIDRQRCQYLQRPFRHLRIISHLQHLFRCTLSSTVRTQHIQHLIASLLPHRQQRSKDRSPFLIKRQLRSLPCLSRQRLDHIPQHHQSSQLLQPSTIHTRLSQSTHQLWPHSRPIIIRYDSYHQRYMQRHQIILLFHKLFQQPPTYFTLFFIHDRSFKFSKTIVQCRPDLPIDEKKKNQPKIHSIRITSKMITNHIQND